MPPARRPNIVFVLVDTLRPDFLGAYGAKQAATPNIDALSADGTQFQHAVAAAPWTLPSVASLFTAVYPSVHKATLYGATSRPAAGRHAESVGTLNQEFVTLAEALRSAGYETAGFSANPFVTERNGFAQGFTTFDSRFASNTTAGSIVNKAFLDWLDKREKGRPFFAYLHYMDVHAPYLVHDEILNPLLAAMDKAPDKRRLEAAEVRAHPGYFAKNRQAYAGRDMHSRNGEFAEYYRTLYEGCVREMDVHIGGLIDSMRQRGIWDDCYLVFTADHGEALGEHRIWSHGLSAHQNQLHVPLILRWPGDIPRGRKVANVVRLIDLYPTLLEQLGIVVPEGIQGTSLASLLREPPSDLALCAFAEGVKNKPNERAVVRDRWKLLVRDDEELFDLDADPMELFNAAAANAAQLADLRSRLELQVAENAGRAAAVVDAPRVPIGPKELERLKRLGYIGGDDEPVDDQP